MGFSHRRLTTFRNRESHNQRFRWLRKINLQMFVPPVSFTHPPESSNNAAGKLLAALHHCLSYVHVSSDQPPIPCFRGTE
jgi:hypothetical protein